MATEVPIPAPEQVGFHPSLASIQPLTIVRSVLMAALPALLDLGSIAIACTVALLLYELHRPLYAQDAWLLWVELSLKYAPVFFILGQAHHLYTQRSSLLQVADTARILKVSAYGLALLSLGNYFTKSETPRLLVTYFWFFATLLLIVQRYATTRIIRDWRSLAADQRRVLICGTNRETRRLFSYLLHSPSLGQFPVGFIDESGFDQRRIIYSHDYKLKQHAPVISEPLSQALLRSLNIQEIFVAAGVSQLRMNELFALAAATGVRVSLVGAGQPSFAERSTSVRMIDGLMVTSFEADGERPVVYNLVKRVTDVIFSAILILLTLPVWIIAAIMVKSTSKGPIFFRQERTGQSDKPFVMLKFRSMYANTPAYGRSPESADDARITRTGRFLRKTSLDELPQLLNVLAGDMSLVGPRPEMPYVTKTYLPLERRRLSVPQGLTGYWQLSGDRKFIIHEAIEYDLYYIENRGIFLDFAILLHTLFFFVNGL
jgi:exopolysaccharide biosynthesis polyprenyl glycosylphosphotransferase